MDTASQRSRKRGCAAPATTLGYTCRCGLLSCLREGGHGRCTLQWVEYESWQELLCESRHTSADSYVGGGGSKDGWSNVNPCSDTVGVAGEALASLVDESGATWVRAAAVAAAAAARLSAKACAMSRSVTRTDP